MTAELDIEFEKWRNRPLPEIAHLILNALFVKVRIDGTLRDCAVFIAVGVRRDDGRRMILGASTGLSEAEIHWRSFLVSAEERLAQIVAKHEKKGAKRRFRELVPRSKKLTFFTKTSYFAAAVLIFFTHLSDYPDSERSTN